MIPFWHNSILNRYMALVLISGIPAAGKTRRAEELLIYFKSRVNESHIEDIHVVNDEKLGIEKSDYYDRESEKRVRGKQMSAVKRLLNPKSIVILDNMTYIKGFRYQLFCEAKAARITSTVLYVGTSENQARKFNELRDMENRWPEDLFKQLVFRYEEPNGMTRWDSPLFIVVPDDTLPYKEMWNSMINQEPQKPNAATLKRSAVAADYLSSLNETTSQITREALELHASNAGAEVTLRGHRIELPYTLTLPQLTRIRRNFVTLNKQNSMPLINIEPFFIDYMQQNWRVTS